MATIYDGNTTYEWDRKPKRKHKESVPPDNRTPAKPDPDLKPDVYFELAARMKDRGDRYKAHAEALAVFVERLALFTVTPELSDDSLSLMAAGDKFIRTNHKAKIGYALAMDFRDNAHGLKHLISDAKSALAAWQSRVEPSGSIRGKARGK